MRDWEAERIARAAGAAVVAGSSRPGDAPGPQRASIDSRAIRAGDLFVGLRGEHSDGGSHAPQALLDGAWGALVAPEHADGAVEAPGGGVVLVHDDPLAGLQSLAASWRGELAAGGTKVLAITGSSGKTSTKDILAALLERSMRVAASPANFNTEIGLPLAILSAPRGSEVLVLEMAMRGAGQIAELTAIAQPDVGVIVNVGPAHLELLGSLEAIAAAKAELIAGLRPGATIVLPAGEPLLDAHLRTDLRTITFGEGGEVELAARRPDDRVLIRHGDEEIELWPSFGQAHNVRNLLAAVAGARALGYTPEGRLEVHFSAMRGQRLRLAGGALLIDDCYNANPMSMRAAIDDLADTATARRVAVLGDMLELGPEAPRLHREIGEHARTRGVELLVSVGPLAAEISNGFAGEAHAVADASAAAELIGGLLRAEDTVLVKGSRGVGLERVVAKLAASAAPTPSEGRGESSVAAPGAGSGRR
jgi:UDP-N-acetylmuramoyl-tripeptide--D-alanyl-D-alanine ligase